jgi:heterodisulfide reductase subunit B
MKIAYYPGCSLHSTAREYAASFEAVCDKLGIELVAPKDWICCGTTPAHSSDHLLSIALPVENLRLAEEAGFDRIVVPCASCFQRLKTAEFEINHDRDLFDTVNKVLDAPYKNTVKIIHPIELLLEPEIQQSLKELSKPGELADKPVACYYGCLLVRPPKIMQFDTYEYPMKMDEVLKSVGIPTLDWRGKTSCCGAAFSLTETDVVIELTQKIFEEARRVGACAIAVACPLCHANLDTRQEEVENKFNTKYGIPILYFTQLMGLALGIEASQLDLGRHLTSVQPLLASVR